MPDLSFKPGTEGDNEKYFYFQREGVNFAKARADIQECASYSSNLALNSRLPEIIPLGSSPDAGTGTFTDWMFQSYGLVGGFMGAFINDAVTSSIERENTRTCMAFKGYSRFAVTEAIWKKINYGTMPEIVTRFALIASGPKPHTEELVP